MIFEFDPKKSTSNELKHGIDFKNGQQLWEDPERLEIPAKVEDENRWVIIGKINDKIWSAIITYRDEAIRIISVRRAHKKEEQLYESKRI